MDKKKEFSEYKAVVDKRIEEFPDSSFFSDIRCMKYDEEYIYMLDNLRKDIVVLDENFNNMNVIGASGQGPNELAGPERFYVKQDTIYVLDYGAEGIKSIYENNVIDIRQMNFISNKHFFYESDYFYVPSIRNSSSFSVIPKRESDNSPIRNGGKIVEYDTGKETYWKNGRNLLYNGDKYFYAVSDNLTKIEKYDLDSLHLVSEFDLSDIPLVKKNSKYILSRKKQQNSVYIPFVDCDINENSIFILCADLGENVRANKIIEIALYSEMRFTSVYTLPGRIYMSFCVSSEYIFAFNFSEASIEKVLLEGIP